MNRSRKRERGLCRVKWEIDVPGNTPDEAAAAALEIMRDKDSTALVFDVWNAQFRRTVDLLDYAVCDECGHVFEIPEDNDFANIPDLNKRIEPGGTVPACECPKCGCLAYLIK
jgi:hypothetical protein